MFSSSRSLSAYAHFLSSLLLLRPLVSAATGQGSVSLWSNSDCAEGDTLAFSDPVVIALNHTSYADDCYTLPREAHSYRVDKRPTCDNGTAAAFAFYGGDNCQRKGFGPALNAVNKATRYDGSCLALVTFKSVAFLCDGVGQGSDESTSESTTSRVRDSTSTSVFIDPFPTATPIAPSISATTPLYTISNTYANETAPTSTVSGVPSVTGGLTPPAPSPFTGGASELKGSLLSVFLAFGLRVFI
ncbi:MAG: hypothetical protein Q9166_001120 [cf. Caloplaca sp. 2 TL-2023]